MKRLINGTFSSIPDAEFIIKTLDARFIEDVSDDINDNPQIAGDLSGIAEDH